jgi:hypothetical protein
MWKGQQQLHVTCEKRGISIDLMVDVHVISGKVDWRESKSYRKYLGRTSDSSLDRLSGERRQ